MPSDASGSPALPRHQILPVSSKASRTRLEEGMNPARQAPRSAPRAPNAPSRVAVACHIPIRLEGRTRMLRGPSPELSPAETLTPFLPPQFSP